jgi:hypothetical protein
MRPTLKPFPIQQNFVGLEFVGILLSGTPLEHKIDNRGWANSRANSLGKHKQPGKQLGKQPGKQPGKHLAITVMAAGAGDARRRRFGIDSDSATFDVGPDFV